MSNWNGAKTRVINLMRKRGSMYYDRDLPDSTHELVLDGYVTSTRFGFGNYELTQKGKDKFIEMATK